MGFMSGYSEPPDIYGEEPPSHDEGEDMHVDDVKRLLQDIDEVECDMRRLESRLTSVRERLFKAAGLVPNYCRFGIDGREKRREVEPQAETADCPF